MTARSISRPVASPFARSILSRVIGDIWTPADLFAQGQQGVWLEASPTYKGQQVLWQQSDGTVIVDANGDPVGRADDLSPNGNNTTQSTSADRPLYQADGGLHWLAFDGAGDSLGASFSTAISQPFVKITAAHVKNDNGRISGSGLDTYGQCWRQGSAEVRMFAGVSLALTGIDLTQTNIIVEIYDGLNSKLRAITGGYDVSVTGDAGTNSYTGFAWANRNMDLYGHVDAYGGIVVSGIPSDADIDKAVIYLAKLAGITL